VFGKVKWPDVENAAGKKYKGVKEVAYDHRPRGFQEVKAPRFRDNGTGWW